MILTQAERIVERFVLAKEQPKVLRFGVFQITVSAANVKHVPVLEEGFSKAERDYASAGFPLKGEVQIVVKGMGWRQRSFFTPNYIGIIPHNLTRPDSFHTFIHELAHWYHWNQVSGGFHNEAIIDKFTEVKSEKVTGGSNYERLQDVLKAKEKELEKLKKSIPRGTVVKLEDWNDPFRHDYKYVREYKVVKMGDRSGHMTFCELLNPSPWDIEVNKHTAKPGEFFAKILTQSILEAVPALAEKAKAMREELSALWDQSNAYAMGKEKETRYEEVRSEWIPTNYARENPLEWFAELMTTMILHPTSLSDTVQAWFKSVV